MRRRLDVAASIILRPDVLFVDEPTTGLDPAARRDLWQVLRRLVANGTTVLLTTQYLEEADALADHILLLARGEVIAEGSPEELKSMLGRSVLHLRFDTAVVAERALPVLAAFDAQANQDGALVTMRGAGSQSLVECIQALTGHGIAPSEAALRKPSLDDVFLSLVEDPANNGVGS